MSVKANKQKLLAWGCVLAWCGVIFFFSAQNSDESNALSNLIVMPLLNLLCQVLPIDAPQETLAATDVITTIVRKGAHMTEYAVLAVLAMRVARLYPLRRKVPVVLLCAMFYAATDEWHQYLDGSRTGQPLDVLIDTAGACIGLFLLHLHSRRFHAASAQVERE